MVRLWSHVIVLLAIYVGLSSSNIKTYYDQEVCGETLVFGKHSFAFEVNFYHRIYRNYSCLSHIKVSSPYVTKLNVESLSSGCYVLLRVETPSKVTEYPLCNLPSFEIDIPSSDNTILGLVAKESAPFAYIEMFYYLFSYLEDNSSLCDSSSYRCLNGRCLNHDLFCYDGYNFCGDGTNRNCEQKTVTKKYKNITEDSPSSSNTGRNVGIIASSSMIALCFVFMLIVYYRCYRSRRNRRSPSNAVRRPTPTAPDVYTIPTSEDNPDEIDYVIDYRKFEEPPPYDSLSAHAHTSERSGCTLSDIRGASAFHSNAATFIMETEANIETNNLHTEPETSNGGVSNEAFENELPSYEEVLSDDRRFLI